MANARKKISQLTALTSASLNTTIVGIDGGTTYKIELDTLADAVSSRVNILDRDRLQSLESQTGSYITSLNGTISGSSQLTSSYDVRYVVSGSITQTTWDNIASKPADIISSSTQISDLGFISSSHTDITSLNSFTQSQNILNTAFTTGMLARLQTSSFNDFSASVHSEIVAATNEQSFDGLISSSVQISDLGFVTGSYTTLNSFNSLTQSFNLISQSFTTISGSVSSVNFSGLISSSAQISEFGFISSSHTDITSLNSFTSSQSILNTAFTNGISARLQTSSFNDFSASVDSRIIEATNTTFVSSSNVLSIQTITSASYATLTPVSGTLYIIIG